MVMQKPGVLLFLIIATLLVSHRFSVIVDADGLFDAFKIPIIEDLLGNNQDEGYGADKISLLDSFLLDVVPLFIGEKPANQNGTKAMFRKYAMEDESNDDAYKMTIVSIENS